MCLNGDNVSLKTQPENGVYALELGESVGITSPSVKQRHLALLI